MFETGFCREDSSQCKQMTGFPTPVCRFFVTMETNGSSIYFYVDDAVEVDWGNDEWITYEQGGVIIGHGEIIQIRSNKEIKTLYFGNRASPEYAIESIVIEKAIDLVNAKRMCYNLVNLHTFGFLRDNKVITFESAWENCINLVNFYALNATYALTIEKAWYKCKSMVIYPGLYSPVCLNADKAWSHCSSMIEYKPIILELCRTWKDAFSYNSSLTHMGFLGTKHGTDFRNMFAYDRILECIDAVDTREFVDTNGMFLGCVVLSSPNSTQQDLILNGYEWINETACVANYCEDFYTYDISSTSYYNFYVRDGNFRVGLNHGGCSEAPGNLPNYGLQCTPDDDCPDCVTFNSFILGGTFEVFNVADGVFHASVEHGVCAPDLNLPPKPIKPGLDCNGVPCPSCVPFNAWDGNYQTDGVSTYDAFVANGDIFYTGSEHANCAPDIGTPPNYGLQCTVDVDCPTCVTFKSHDGNGVFVNFIAATEQLTVGSKHSSCAQDPNQDAFAVGIGLDCLGVEPCPDCSGLKTWDGNYPVANSSTFDNFIANGDTYILSSVSGVGCDSFVAPGVPSNVTASTTLAEQVSITWVSEAISNPKATENIYRDNIAIGHNVSSPFIDIITAGTYNYHIDAVNSIGTTSSLTVEGKSLSGTIPELHEQFITNGDIFHVGADLFKTKI